MTPDFVVAWLMLVLAAIGFAFMATHRQYGYRSSSRTAAELRKPPKGVAPGSVKR